MTIRLLDTVPIEDVLYAWQQAMHDGLIPRTPAQKAGSKRSIKPHTNRVKPRHKGA